jgi:hypothetical protein
MLYALEKGISADAFVVYTDSETWAGAIHPVQALRQYREKTGIAAKLVVVGLSRDSPLDQRIDISLTVQRFGGLVDFAVERFDIGERLMGEMMRLEIVPDDLDVIEFGRVFGEPFDGQPVTARIKRRQGHLAAVDRPIVQDQQDGFCHAAGFGAVKAVELLQMRNEISTALRTACIYYELTLGMIEGAHHGDFLGLPRCRYA